MSRRCAHLRLAGIEVDVVSNDRSLIDGLGQIWDGFTAPDPGSPAAIEVDLLAGRAPTSPGPREAKQVRFDADASGGGTFELAEGRVTVDADGRHVTMTLADPHARDRAWAVHNLLLPVFAWTLGVVRRGALVHGAAVLLGGRAFVLVGPEGSGKSTFAAQAALGGAEVLGEDLAFLDRSGGRVDVLGAPYRTENATLRGVGRWPLAAILTPRHARTPAVEDVPRLTAVARLAANLPYVAAAGHADAVADRLVETVGVKELGFAPDPGFLEVLDAIAGSVGRGDSPEDSGK